VIERFPAGTLVKLYVPEAVRIAVVAAGESLLHDDEHGYLSHYDEDSAVVMVLGGPTIAVPEFCVARAERT
jgi:hypothetical protein